jgi:hypothetical protein
MGVKLLLHMATKPNPFFRLFGVPHVDMSVAYTDNQPIKKELPEIVEILKLWTYKAKLLRFFQIFLGVIATFFSLLTATLIGDTTTGYNDIAKGTAFIAAFAVALMTGFDLGTKANNVVRAWRKLHVAVINFNKEPADKADRSAVIKAYEEGESMIGDVSYQGGSSR